MAGHSKWKNTKHRKIIQDTKRGRIFSKLIREVKTAAKVGGKDIAHNTRLRVIFEKALSKNMTKDTFNRAVFDDFDVDNRKVMEDVVYEGYGPGGIAILLKCLTDNKNRIVSEVRYAFSKFGGHLGTNGSVSYLFNKKGIISCTSDFSEDIIIDMILKVGADDVIIYSNGIVDIYVSLKLLSDMKLKFRSFGFKIHESKVAMIPDVKVILNENNSLQLIALVDMLKNISGVYEIHHNGKVSKLGILLR